MFINSGSLIQDEMNFNWFKIQLKSLPASPRPASGLGKKEAAASIVERFATSKSSRQTRQRFPAPPLAGRPRRQSPGEARSRSVRSRPQTATVPFLLTRRRPPLISAVAASPSPSCGRLPSLVSTRPFPFGSRPRSVRWAVGAADFARAKGIQPPTLIIAPSSATLVDLRLEDIPSTG